MLRYSSTECMPKADTRSTRSPLITTDSLYGFSTESGDTICDVEHVLEKYRNEIRAA